MRINPAIKKKVIVAAFCFLGLAGTAQGDTLARIQESGVLKVGTEAAMPPLEFVQDGKIVGFGKDILDHIVAKNKLSLDQVNLPWQGILPGLTAKRFDLVATAVTITPARAKNFAFTIPVAESTTYVLKRADNDSIKTMDDLNGKIGGTQIGSATEAVLRKWDKEQKEKGKPGLKEIKLYTTFPEVYLGVANGELDIGVHSLTALTSLMKNRPGIYDLVGRISDRSFYAWLTRPEDKTLRDFINKNFEEMIKDGKMEAIQKKWFSQPVDLPLTGYLPEGAQ